MGAVARRDQGSRGDPTQAIEAGRGGRRGGGHHHGAPGLLRSPDPCHPEPGRQRGHRTRAPLQDERLRRLRRDGGSAGPGQRHDGRAGGESAHDGGHAGRRVLAGLASDGDPGPAL